MLVVSFLDRKKTLLDFVRLSFVIMGIEIVYSAETAFVTPILLGIGIEHQLMTIVWGISPLIGFIVSPFLGTFSDRCRSRFGRRRPLLVVLGMGLVLGKCKLFVTIDRVPRERTRFVCSAWFCVFSWQRQRN